MINPLKLITLTVIVNATLTMGCRKSLSSSELAKKDYLEASKVNDYSALRVMDIKAIEYPERGTLCFYIKPQKQSLETKDFEPVLITKYEVSGENLVKNFEDAKFDRSNPYVERKVAGTTLGIVTGAAAGVLGVMIAPVAAVAGGVVDISDTIKGHKSGLTRAEYASDYYPYKWWIYSNIRTSAPPKSYVWPVHLPIKFANKFYQKVKRTVGGELSDAEADSLHGAYFIARQTLVELKDGKTVPAYKTYITTRLAHNSHKSHFALTDPVSSNLEFFSILYKLGKKYGNAKCRVSMENIAD